LCIIEEKGRPRHTDICIFNSDICQSRLKGEAPRKQEAIHPAIPMNVVSSEVITDVSIVQYFFPAMVIDSILLARLQNGRA
jgi:hypothetical protein